MAAASILNNVLGPVMPGPSSSHTAGPYHIAKMCRSFIGENPASVTFTFEPGSSIAEVYHEQGSDAALAMGILGLPLTDRRFRQILEIYPDFGIKIDFNCSHFAEAIHPNSIRIEARLNNDSVFSAVADSIGGGSLLFRFVNGWPVELAGDAYHLLFEAESEKSFNLMMQVSEFGNPTVATDGERTLFAVDLPVKPDALKLDALRKMAGVTGAACIEPVFFPLNGECLFRCGEDMIAYAEQNGLTLGAAALKYEAALLGMREETLNSEMDSRLRVMTEAVKLGLSKNSPPMSLLGNSAGRFMQAEKKGKLALGGVHARAAARALAAMEVNSGRGIVCAAPTGGSAGVIPAVMATMLDDLKIKRKEALRSLWAAGAIGMVLATRGTFAAEVCGCQVEIGAAGAMAAAAVTEMAGGTPRQAADAAAIAFHNSMGLVCDLVQATVEIPCHTRNACFAPQAFICADLALGGYRNAVNLDDTIDAVVATGRQMPPELRCTSLGGIAVTPSAINMKKR